MAGDAALGGEERGHSVALKKKESGHPPGSNTRGAGVGRNGSFLGCQHLVNFTKKGGGGVKMDDFILQW